MSLNIPPKAVMLQHNADAGAHAALERRTLSITNNTDTQIAVTLETNRIYSYTQPAVSLAIDTAQDFLYGGLNFITGEVATVFTTPQTWIFNGDDCTWDNIFVPAVNAYYRLALEKLGDAILCDVQKYRVEIPTHE